jgi:hypothetical protein
MTPDAANASHGPSARLEAMTLATNRATDRATEDRGSIADAATHRGSIADAAGLDLAKATGDVLGARSGDGLGNGPATGLGNGQAKPFASWKPPSPSCTGARSLASFRSPTE